MINRSILFVIVIIFLGSSVWGQTGETAEENEVPPVPYSRDEFPDWAMELRRSEIIFFGSLPFSFLFSSLGYRTGTYAWNYFTAEPGETVPGWNEMTRNDQINIIYITLGMSFSTALLDWILGKIEDNRGKKE